MRRLPTLYKFLSVVSGSALVVLAFAYFASSNLYVNGALASSKVIDVKGVAYVPVKDLAKALNMSVTKTGRGFEMGTAGGGNMVGGLVGKLNEELFNGFHRFKVTEVIRGKSYTNRFAGDHQAVTPYPEGNDLVVVVCRLKNGTEKPITLGLPAGGVTGLTDMDEHSYEPRSGMSADIPARGVDLLPGAACDFALTFDVPAGAVLKDLVYEPTDYNGHKVKPFRISLKS